jgi:hypothetical protein
MPVTSSSRANPSFYGPVDDAHRQSLLAAYVDHLQHKNGQPDPRTGALPRREERLAQMDASPLRYAGHLSQTDFDRLYDRFGRFATALSPDLLLLLTLCKMNGGEAYGVRVVKGVYTRLDKYGSDLRGQVMRLAQQEEEYHTRILVGAARQFDIRVVDRYRPTLLLKVLIHAIAYAPRALMHPILYSAEVAGIYLFYWTLNRIRGFLPGQTELQELLEQRLTDILVDEVGHVAFNRLVMSPRELALGASLAGLTLRGLPQITPEASALGFRGQTLSQFAGFDYLALPAEVRRRGFFA